jgi:nicotinamidase-related amidase
VEAFAARGFGGNLGFGSRPALVIVDLVNGFTDPASPLGSSMTAEVEATKIVLGAARVKRIPTFFTTVAYDDSDLQDSGVWAKKIAGLTILRNGSTAVQVDERLERAPDEAILVKKYASAFFGTDLGSRLTSRSIDTILIAGCSTSGCVRATAVDALQLGFRPIVIRECVADRSAAAHEQSLFDLEQKYADVISVDNVLSYLNELKETS